MKPLLLHGVSGLRRFNGVTHEIGDVLMSPIGVEYAVLMAYSITL